MAYPEPTEVAPWYLRNITQALALDSATGNVYIRTGITGDVVITGPVTIPGTVTVNSSAADPVHVHLDEVGTSGILTTPYLPVGGNVDIPNGVSVTGNVNASILGNVTVQGNVTVVQGTNPWTVTGNVNASILGNINASILGNVTVSNFPSVQSITGNVNALVTGNVSIIGNVSVIGNVNASVTGNVNASVIGNVNASILGNVNVTQGTSPWSITGNVQIANAATDLTIADSTYEMNVARGLIAGQYLESKNGFATGINQNDEVTIWNNATLYPWSSWTVAQKLYIISTSASDTGQVIRIEGLDASYNRITEDVTTNGLTAVATTQNFLRLNRGYIVSGNANVGTISERLVNGTGTVVGSMAPGFSRNKGGFFTVPNGYTAYIQYIDATQFRGGSGNIGGVLKMYTRTGVGPFLCQIISEVVNGQYNNTLNVPLIAPEQTDIDFRIVADGNGTQATCFWQMILVAN
jgi:hypothetical protein